MPDESGRHQKPVRGCVTVPPFWVTAWLQAGYLSGIGRLGESATSNARRGASRPFLLGW
jgi:hypothetical protein